MKVRCYFTTAILAFASTAFALDGETGLHDPSTIVRCDGKFYTYGTGRGCSISVSDDGWTWRRVGSAIEGPSPEVLAVGGNNTWAPDVIKLGDRYYMYYSAPGRQPKAAIGMVSNKTLDPDSPDYRWEDGGPIVWSDGQEDCNAIDPGLLLDPTDGRLWLTYGSYFGFIRLVELDPETGKRLHPDQAPINIAINCEASIMIYHDGWYYLLATHGSCCAGANSSYHIRVGRAKQPTGPFVDNMGIDMLQGGGKLFLGSSGPMIGAGHFGLLDLGDGIQRFSCHFEADLDRGGTSVLDIRPLLWKDGWPVAGENLTAGTYRIESLRTGTALEMAVEGVPVGGPRRRGFRDSQPREPIPAQDATQVSANWPGGAIGTRMAIYMVQAQQKWDIQPASDAGGYPGSPYFRITIAGTDRALAATADRELEVQPAFTGASEQLWRIEQRSDGSYSIFPKSIPNSAEVLALSAVGSSFATLAKFDPEGEKQRWYLQAP